jgi:hypothetical protein
MPGIEQIRCGCGGQLHRPLPRECPHCGRRIVQVRRKWWSAILPILAVLFLFAVLVAYLFWISRN